MKGNENHLRVAVVNGAHALLGRLKIFVVSDNLNRFQPGNSLLLKEKNGYNSYTIEDFQVHKGKICLLSLKGIDNRDKAMSLKGVEIFITKEDAEKTRNELDEDSFYYYDLIGCSVLLDNTEYGELIEINQGGAGEVLVIKNLEGKKVLIPFVDSMVSVNRVKEGIIEITPIEGLLD